jgi:apolipoprotein N-acyltransferase
MRLIPARLWGLTLLSAVLQILPFPIAGPTPIWRTAFCWIALLPLFAALISNTKTGKSLTLPQGALLGYACGFLWYLGNCYWIYPTMYLYGGLPKPIAAGLLVLFSLYLGFYHALFATIMVACRRSRIGKQGALLLAPFIWVAVELARARITGLPWDLLGIAQVDNPLLVRLAPITGAYGLSFVIALVNALWLVRIRIRDRRYTRPALTIAGVIFVVVYVFVLRHTQSSLLQRPTATATLVQENLSVGAAAENQPLESTAQLIQSFSTLSIHPANRIYAGIPEYRGTPLIILQRRNPDAPTPTGLIVWPEAPSGFFTSDPNFHQRMNELAASTNALLIIGSIGIDPNPDPHGERNYLHYDSAAIFTPDGLSHARYDKIHLVPWGEYIPYKNFFFFASKLTAGAGDMDRGTQRTVFAHDGHTYGTFVCYESIFGDEVRQFVKNGAEVLVNISDDGWYGDTSAPWQHLNMVRMRAIENHRWILRSTNTGVTAAINPHGIVTAAAPRHIRTSINVGYGYEHDLTFYTAHGDLFAYLCSLVTILALAFSLAPRNALN